MEGLRLVVNEKKKLRPPQSPEIWLAPEYPRPSRPSKKAKGRREIEPTLAKYLLRGDPN